MSPFVLFRVWARRASVADRALAAVATIVALALLVWIAIPSKHSSSNLTAMGNGLAPVSGSNSSPSASNASTSQPGSVNRAASGGTPSATYAGGGSTPVGSNGTSAGASQTTPATGATSPGGGVTGSPNPSSPGTTPPTCSGPLTPAKIGVVIPDVGSGSASLNNTFGIPPASEEQSDYAAVFDAINKSGGVACHSLVGDYAVFNETDPSGVQTECLQFVQDHVAAVLGGWLPSSADTCALQNHLPTIEQEEIPASQVRQFYPYYLSVAGELDLTFHNFAHALSAMGYFSAAKGFKKAGIFYRDCISGEYQAMVGQLEQVGIPSSEITGYDVGCSSSPFAPPSTVEAAILNFQQAGVTDVIPMNEYEDLQAFTRQANSQGFKPQYLVADDGLVATSSSLTFEPNSTNFNGAVAITPYQYGAEQSGIPETATTKRCDQIMTSHGLPTVYNSGDNFAGVVCSEVFMLVAGIDHDPGLNPSAMAGGLASAGPVQVSYPDGPNNFQAASGAFGGEYWRPLLYQAGCACWKVTNSNFSPSYS